MNIPKKKLRSHLQGFPSGAGVKEPICQRRRQEFDPCSGKIPHAAGQLSHNYRACASEPGTRNYRSLGVTTTEAHGPGSPRARKPALGSQRPLQREPATTARGQPHSPQPQESPRSHGDSARPKQRWKGKKQHFHSQYQQNKILRNKLNKRGVKLTL